MREEAGKEGRTSEATIETAASCTVYAMMNVKTDCRPLLFHSWKKSDFSPGKMAIHASIPTNGSAVVSCRIPTRS